MNRLVTVSVSIVSILLLLTSNVVEARSREGHLLLAQAPPATDDEEPTPPGSSGPAKTGAKNDEEPTKGEPTGGAPGDEPGDAASEGEPTPPPASDPAAPAGTKVATKKEVTYGAGFQFRGIFVPTWFLGMFLDHSTGLASVSLGGEFVRRKGNLDIVASLNFGFYSPPDGNFLGNGKQPAVDTDYIQFDGLNVLALDVAFIWHHEFTPWLSLVYGAGLGLGFVIGDIYRISNYQGKCTHDNLDDFGQCNPVPPGGDQASWNANREAYLANGCHQEGGDSPTSPCQFREDDVWPVVPIVHLLIGVNFKINEQFSVRVDGGFHNAFYFGATGHYFFF